MITESNAPKLTKNEGLKSNNPLLTGTIVQTLNDEATPRFTDEDYEFLKFHGVYQQDDRDQRKIAKHYMMMVRTKFPGGVLNANQYLTCDRLATEFGNNTLRITTRQDFQFHGIIKSNLRKTIHDLNEALVTTIAACGDVNRNVLAPPTPSTSPLVDEVIAEAKKISDALAPRTPAYHSIWLEGQEVNLNEPANSNFIDPLYGKSYLPRKFKVAFAIPPLNDIDIFANDLGFVVIQEDGHIAGYNLLAGGGLGMSHGNLHTFPRVADVIGFLPPSALEAISKAVVTIHRDFGDRTNRKHARLKYIIAEKGVDWFRGEVEKRADVKLEPAREFHFDRQADVLGWRQQSNGNYFLGLFVENGRIRDEEGYQLKTGLRRVIEKFQPEVRLTAAQNILLCNIRPENRADIKQLLSEHGISVHNTFSRTRLASMACPALPTCGLALAESERALPGLLTRIEQIQAELGLQNEEIVIRMTGCPNGCARPYLAELALVGKAPHKYQMFLGGNEASTRLNRVYKETVKDEELNDELRKLLTRFRDQRQDGERLGDFSARVIWPELVPAK